MQPHSASAVYHPGMVSVAMWDLMYDTTSEWWYQCEQMSRLLFHLCVSEQEWVKCLYHQCQKIVKHSVMLSGQ